MKKLLLTLPFSLLATFVSAQQMAQVTLSNSGPDNSFTFFVDGNVQVNISKDGNIIEWGTALEPYRMGYYPGKLQPFIGRVEYYGAGDNEAFRGKPKYIGSAAITYYTSYENENFTGKVKSIGSSNLDYYTSFENEAYRGKLKSAGGLSITYYASYDNEAYRGRLKSVGSTNIAYYSSFDDKAYKGKLKSIGNYTYSYYSSFEKREYSGIMKTGNPVQLVNSVNYILRY
jgi:hypothetical protein